MKRTPLVRKTPLRRRPLQQVQAEVQQEGKRMLRRAKTQRKRRRNDAQWRQECLDLRGPQCRVTGCLRMTDVQVDHLIPRAHGGPSIAENGLVLCREHHEMKTNHDLLVDPTWLDPDQILWLSDNGYAEWLFDGVVVGSRRRIFADGPDRRTEEGKQ